MDTTERYFKILLDILLFIPFALILNNFNVFYIILESFILVHTINWVFNGQIFVLLKNLNLLKNSPETFSNYLNNFKVKVENESSISAASAFGSISRKNLKKSSDLDIRVIRKPGILNGFKSCFFVLKERSISFFQRFPLDIYVLDDVKTLSKHIKNEDPIIIYDPDNIFKINYNY